MIEFLSAMSLLFGIILHDAAIIALVIILVLFVIALNTMLPESSCTGNCNQGRNCTCKGK
jgi:hypothetical protein